MPSNADIKRFASLRMPKYRQKYGQFIVEGRKNVLELFHSDYEIDIILATSSFLERHDAPYNAEPIDEKDYARISQMETPPGVLAVARTRTFLPEEVDFQREILLALDGISDPGNLGTMLRTADWFGITHVLLSPDCTDFYSHKCISATMGSFTRIRPVYCRLETVLQGKRALGCFMDGMPLSEADLQGPLIVVVGNEARGIRPETGAVLNSRVAIPGAGRAESLNASVAAGIVMHEVFRRNAV